MAGNKATRNSASSSVLPDTPDLSRISLSEVQASLAYSAQGLGDAEVLARLKRYGYNEISEKKPNPFLKFLTYFWGPIPWMIEIAVVLSAVVQHWPDFYIIWCCSSQMPSWDSGRSTRPATRSRH
jgi:H+-transporting ATPase